MLASSVPSEQANFVVCRCSADRDKMHPCTFQAEMCLRSWLRILCMVNSPIPDNFHEAFEKLEVDFDTLVTEDSIVDYLMTNKK